MVAAVFPFPDFVDCFKYFEQSATMSVLSITDAELRDPCLKAAAAADENAAPCGPTLTTLGVPPKGCWIWLDDVAAPFIPALAVDADAAGA